MLLACKLLSLFLDYSEGFGGKYGIDKDKVDKSAVGFEYQGKTEKHESQTGACILPALQPVTVNGTGGNQSSRQRRSVTSSP